MGDTGVGKTLLMNYLVREIFKEDIIFFQIHAGINKKDIENFILELI